MLNRTELLLLERSVEAERVLTVYVDGTETNVAEKSKWRVDLAHSIDEVRASIAGASSDEREAFERCVALLETELTAFPGSVGAPGWVAFITADGVQRAEPVPAPAPTVALWGTGPSIAPYIRMLKELTPVIVAVVDARKGKLYQYRAGELALAGSAHARIPAQDRTHMGDPPRAGFHGGVRGETGRDAAQRSALTGTQRMLRELAEQATRLAGGDAWVVIGGIPKAAARLKAALDPVVPRRVVLLDSLGVRATDAEVAAAAREGASQLRDAADLVRIDAIVDEAHGSMMATIGPMATREALAAKRVRELYLTNRYRRDHAMEAESAVRLALSQGAMVEEVSRHAAERLDDQGGMGAMLRYQLAIPPAPPA